MKNLALIENVTIEFGEGLNILSGETGAGKSMIVQALELLLGERAQMDLIRHGEEEAEVTGQFQVGEEDCFLRRVLSRTGRHKAFLNDRLVPLSVLQEMGQRAVDLAGQHEHQILLKPSSHILFLDEYAQLASKLIHFQEELSRCREQAATLQKMEGQIRETKEKEEFLQFQLKELKEAQLQEGEETKLLEEKGLLKNATKILEICSQGEEVLEAGELSVTDQTAKFLKEVRSLGSLGGEWNSLAEGLEEVLCRLKEFATTLRSCRDRLGFENPHRLQEVEDRLALIERLKKKQMTDLSGLIAKEQELQKRLSLVEEGGEEMEALSEPLKTLEKNLLKELHEIARKRKEAGKRLEEELSLEFQQLGMSARLSVRMEAGHSLNERGADEIEFLLSPNPGEGFHSLSRMASGGEISRIFLALKKVLGYQKEVATLIFDEVDAGIGGRIAEVVGRNLSELARKKQVICITHLPQVACYAKHHFVIQKKVAKGRTQTQVQRLKDVEREGEIARMLAGLQVTENAVTYAREMIRHATERTADLR